RRHSLSRDSYAWSSSPLRYSSLLPRSSSSSPTLYSTVVVFF
ncbi:hypothetical protein ISN45_Aa01g034480, partial [Arabidopsis thaliana x Arabidopsis arenosa]